MSDDLGFLVRRYLQLGTIIDDAKQEQDVLKEKFRQLGVGKYQTDAAPVVVSPNRRFDRDTAEKVLRAINPDLIAACSETVLTAAKARAVLPPPVYESCMKASPDHKVNVG